MISTTTNRVAYQGDGSSATFAFAYPFYGQSDLKVFLYASSSGQISQQTLNTNYSIGGSPNLQGVYSAGGSVIVTCAVPSTHMVVIYRDGSQLQSYQLLQNGQINSVALVQQLDYLTLLCQRLQDEATRSLQLRDGFGRTFDMGIPAECLVASTVLIVNSSATGWAVGPTADQIYMAQSAAISAGLSMIAAGLSAASALTSAATATSSALSATNNAVLAASAALSASISASIVGSSAFWGAIAASAALSATNQAVLSASGALSASNSAALAASGAVSASNQAVLSASGALSATNQAVLAASAALSATNSIGTITFPISVPNGGTGTQGLTQFAVAVWNGSSAITTAGATTPGYVLAAAPTGSPNWGSLEVHTNLLVNSAFDHWQNYPNGSSVINGGQKYFSDCWYVNNFCGTSAVITCTRVGGQVNKSINGCQVQITAAPTAGQANGTELWQILENQSVMANVLGQTAGWAEAKIKALGNVNEIGIQFFQANSETKIIGQTGSSFITEGVFTVNSASFTTCQQSLGTGVFTAGSSGVIGMRIRITNVSTGSTHVLNNGFIIEQAYAGFGKGIVQPTWSRRKQTPDGELMDVRRFAYTTLNPGVPFPVTSSAASGMFTWATGNVTAGTGWSAGGYLPFPQMLRAVPTLSYADAVGVNAKLSYWRQDGSRIDGSAPTNPFIPTRVGVQAQVVAAGSSNYIGAQMFFDSYI